MPKIPEFKVSDKKSYYRRKEINHFISQIAKYLSSQKQESSDEIAQIDMVKVLLSELVEFRKATHPKKLSSKDHSKNNDKYIVAKNKVDQVIRSLYEAQNEFKNSDISPFISEAISYALKSMEIRTEHLEKKQLITKTKKESEYLSLESGNQPAPLPNANRNPDCYIPPEAYRDELPRIDVKSNVLFGNELGSGAFGVVYEAKVTNETLEELNSMGLVADDEGIVVVKVLKDPDEKSLLAFKKEAVLADKIREAALRGEHGSQFVCLNTLAINEQGELLIVGKIERRGRLKDFLAKQFLEHAPASQKIDILRKIYKQQKAGLLFLHNNNFLHCDLALRNILIDANGFIKISDFGLAQQITSDPNAETSHGIGAKLPRRWTDEKTLLEHRSNRDSDLFSFKVMMLEEFATILTGNPTKIWLDSTADEYVQMHIEKGDDGYLRHLADTIYDFIKNPANYMSAEDAAFYTPEEKALFIEYLKEICGSYHIPRPTALKQVQNVEATQNTTPVESPPQSDTPNQPPTPIEPEEPDYPTTSVRERAYSFATPNDRQKNNNEAQSHVTSKLASSPNVNIRQAFSLFQTADNQAKTQTNPYIPQPTKTHKR